MKNRWTGYMIEMVQTWWKYISAGYIIEIVKNIWKISPGLKGLTVKNGIRRMVLAWLVDMHESTNEVFDKDRDLGGKMNSLWS